MKLGIRGRLFAVSFGLIVASVGIADLTLTRALDADLTDRIQRDLFVRVRLVARTAEATGAPLDDRHAWDDLADDLGRRGEGRVTFLRADGLVLGDSDLDGPDLYAVENHSGRPEFVEALSRGEGSSMRWSDTVGRRMLYVAVPIRRGGEVAGVARLSEPLTKVDEAIGRLRRLVLLASALALATSVLLSSLAAHWVSASTRALASAAQQMAEGDLDARAPAAGPDEVAELGKALDQLASSLKRALQDLRAERDRLGRVLDGMAEGVLLLDAESRVQLANPALREMLLLGSDVVGKTPLEIARNAELKRILDAARVDVASSGEVELGELKPRRLLVHAIRLADEPGGLLAGFVDVTDLRRLESIRRDFVANVSHELRTPVASLRAAAETLRMAMTSDLAAAAEFVEIIERNSLRLHRLVEDLLDLSRIESRGYRLSIEDVDAASVAAHVASLFAPDAAAREIRVRVDAPTGCGPARADRRALEQVLTNLVDNAVKYGRAGGTVTVRLEPQTGHMRIHVQDDGPGIEPVHLPRLFERFYRVDPGRSRALGGTGLGLSIVKHLVGAMGGTVAVESVVGQGTTFSFTLPGATALRTGG